MDKLNIAIFVLLAGGGTLFGFSIDGPFGRRPTIGWGFLMIAAGAGLLFGVR